MKELYDEKNLFRTPIRLKGPSAGQMLMKAIDKEALATSKAHEFPFSTCVECGREIPVGSMQRCEMTSGGFCSWRVPAAVREFMEANSLFPETSILNSQAAPKYSLKTQLWIGAWIFLSIASGVALGFMKGCR